MSEYSVPPPQMDEEERLEWIIDSIGSAKPALAEALRLCAIPHWFNREVLAWLQGYQAGALEQAEAILDELRRNKLAFEHGSVNGGYSLHGSVRKLLLQRWRNQDAARFQELSEKAVAYCTRMLRSGKLTREQRAEWEREEMYHLLAADNKRGIDRFIELSSSAIDTYRLTTLDLLLDLAREQANGRGTGTWSWIRFFEGKKDLVSGHWEKARRTWEGLRAKRGRIGIDLEKALAIHLAILYKDKGEWHQAINCFQDSLEIIQRAGDEHGTITLLNNRGFLYKDKEQWKEAEKDFRQGLAIAERLNDQYEMAHSLKNLGLLYKDHRKWAKAVECFRDSLKNFKKMDDARGMAMAYSDLGFLYKDRKQWDQAIQCFRQSQKSLDVLRDEHGEAAVFNSLGFLYTNKQEWKKAEENFQRALQILEQVGDERRRADTFSYLGTLFRDNREWEKAEGYLQQSLEILERLEDERGMAAGFHNLGLLYRSRQDREKAERYFQQSLKIVNGVHDKMNAATTMYELALLYEQARQYNKSIKLLKQVGKIVDSADHPDPRIRSSEKILERVQAKAASE
jgi:tetratricopeptide (TPR) repeat protein